MYHKGGLENMRYFVFNAFAKKVLYVFTCRHSTLIKSKYLSLHLNRVHLFINNYLVFKNTASQWKYTVDDLQKLESEFNKVDYELK